LGEKIAEEFEKGYNTVIMENHGTVIGGANLKDAYVRFETFEFSGRIIIGASTVGDPGYLSDDQIDEFESSIPHDIPEMEEMDYNSDELTIQTNISELVRRACEKGLMISSCGTVSER